MSDEDMFRLEKRIKKAEAIIACMTEEERTVPDLLARQVRHHFLYRNVLYYAVQYLCCTVLHCITLYGGVLYITVLFVQRDLGHFNFHHLI